MNEDFLHYLWKYKKFNFSDLKTTNEEEIVLKKIGNHNQSNAGPDFFNAQLMINDQKWAGNVEIHIKSSDWYAHHHETDPLYDNVILHVVWDDDIEIFRKDNTAIPALQLKEYVDNTIITQYKELVQSNTKNWIQCKNQLPQVSGFVIANWQERLYLERLEEKSIIIKEMLVDSSNDWEAVLFKLLAKNFGLNVNKGAFLSLVNSFDFSIVRKCSNNLGQLESLFFGQAGLLKEETIDHPYSLQLKNEFDFLKNKYKFDNQGVIPFQFFRLRPPNFPTIRLSQLANLYFKRKQLFNEIINRSELDDFYDLFAIETSDFWKNHYTFEKESPYKRKSLTKSFIHLLLINTVIPIKFLYTKNLGKNPENEVLTLMSQLPPEKNTIIKRFSDLGVAIEDSVHSQAMIQLKNKYCDKKACLKCAIGNYLLDR
ncbi:DUF2851 family protein [Aquimarina sp. RZ0]|uniref:DUF2851 family protein n=1 Tax=Aquimarina sp. RZ0 TaxID=2607730 RepID=UPI0011F26C1C|nr:DUF2851 family protein [Aquimarina sp. RZ0]KAA1243838.1 DUF2851 family protein [Aquimarina sp. RZ0]